MKKTIKPILGPIVRPLLYLIHRYLLKKKPYSKYMLDGVTITGIGSDNVSFFGYYNITPFNNDNEVLFCSLKSNEQCNSYVLFKIEICKYNTEKKQLTKLGESNSWNWQQGCMLQWFKNSNDQIIYNDYNETSGEYYSKIINIKSGVKINISAPIYSVSKNGEYALSLNFDRLAWLRPDYGYFSKNKIKMLNLHEDGIWKIDIKNNSKKLIISLCDLISIHYVKTMKTDKHKVNHIDISPDAEHFMFLYRWFDNDVKYTRLIVSDKNGKNIRILCGDKMVSHCIWKNNEEIVGFAFREGTGSKYYKFDINTGKVELFYPDYLTEDGHPSFDESGRYFLTDTYPKRERFAKLLMIDTETDKFYKLGDFFQPLKYLKKFRVDLHPRFSRDGNYISIDSGHSGIRQQYILNIEGIINESKAELA